MAAIGGVGRCTFGSLVLKWCSRGARVVSERRLSGGKRVHFPSPPSPTPCPPQGRVSGSRLRLARGRSGTVRANRPVPASPSASRASSEYTARGTSHGNQISQRPSCSSIFCGPAFIWASAAPCQPCHHPLSQTRRYQTWGRVVLGNQVLVGC